MNASKKVLAGGLSWNVIEAGHGPVVLLVHGTAASVHSWRDVIPLLTQTHHVIAMDLPGHGGTKQRSTADLSLESMGLGIVALTKALGVSPNIVVGHSAGAAILAWACARKHLKPETYISFNGAFYPFAGIAGSLFSPIAKLIAFNAFVPRLVSNIATRTKVEKLLNDTGSKINDEGVEHYLKLYKEPAHVAAALGMMAAWDLRGMDDNLVRIDANCVFVAATGDKAVPPETAARAAARCRKAKHLQISGFGHLLHEENPQRAADIIRGQY